MNRPIFIQRDYTPSEQTIRYNLRTLNKKIRDKNRNIKTKIGEFCLYINDKKLAWSNENFIAFSKDDLKYFMELFQKLDLNINIIKSNHKKINTIEN